jgi:uncharacterized membrane protein YjjP (DUF1212 family)
VSINNSKAKILSPELYLKKVLQIAVYGGEVMLRSGAETARVEETIEHLTRSFGVSDSNNLVTPTGIFVSVNSDTHDLPLTLVRRVRGRSLNLGRIAEINDISRRASRGLLTLDEVEVELHRVESTPDPFPLWLLLLAGAGTASGVTVLLGGSLLDSAITLASGLVVQLLMWLLACFKIPRIFGEFSGAALATAFALFSAWLGLPIHQTLVIAGGIIMLVPGAALLASVQDGIAGDLLSSGARGLETLLKGAAVAGGVGLALRTGSVLNIQASLDTTQGEIWQIPIQVAAAILASACYAIVFHIPVRAILPAGLAGGLCWLVYLLALPATQSALIATFLASFAAGLVSWVLARLRQSPTTLYTLPGVLPLLPGLPIYSGMLALSQNRSNDGILQLITATFLGGAIAAGVALSNTVLAQVWRLSLLGRAKKQP